MNGEASPLPAGATLRISGWGLTSNQADQPQDLMWAPVPAADCSLAAAFAGAIKPGMVCAGVPDGRIDACDGDSGGPAVYGGTQQQPLPFTLYGVVSWGANGQCAPKGNYGVYAGVQPHLPWIRTFLHN